MLKLHIGLIKLLNVFKYIFKRKSCVCSPTRVRNETSFFTEATQKRKNSAGSFSFGRFRFECQRDIKKTKKNKTGIKKITNGKKTGRI